MKTAMPPVVAAPSGKRPMVLLGCGILHKEVEFLIRKNGWQIETQFLDSSLHNYFGKLATQLDAALAEDHRQGRETVVFYGCCHPQMEDILADHHTLRTHGQNCIVMLLGYEKFMAELERGAYFLLEDWALTWEPMITECFGKNPQVIREIFHNSHKEMIAIRTPCSSDFQQAAEKAAAYVELPLRWMDADLSQLELVLAEAISRKQQTFPGK